MPNQRTQFWLAMCQAILQDRPFCRINPAAPVIRRSTFTPLSPHDLATRGTAPSASALALASYKSPGIDAYQKQLELV